VHEGAPDYVYIAERWEAALDQSASALDELRAIFPSHQWNLTETGTRAIDDAMGHIKDGILALHRAGRHILGPEQYDHFMEQRLERAVEKVIEREEIR
jgi:signal transduction histidine kinase